MDPALLSLRLPVLALAFLAGILIAPRSGPFAAAPATWATAAVLVATLSPRRRSVALGLAILALVLLGGARAALDCVEDRTTPGVYGADDRALDELRGSVRGPVEDRAGVRRFLLAAEQPPGVDVLVTVRGRPLPEVLPGDRVRLIGRLRTPRGFRVPGAADARRMVAARGASFTITVDRTRLAIVAPGGESSIWRWPVATQRSLSRRISARGGDRAGNAVVRAMVTGDRGGLEPEVVDIFREAGVSHVLAVSGLHLAAVALLVFAVVRRLWAAVPDLALRVQPALAAALCAAPAGVAYTFVTGARVSTLRALLVVLVLLLGAATARRARVIDALGFAALLLLTVSPATARDPSFQLSFSAAATLALVLGGARRDLVAKENRAGRHAALDRLAYALRRAVGGLLRASFWAAAATAPFAALSFGRVASGGLVANLFVVPAAELVILPLGLLGVLLSSISAGAGGLLIDVATHVAGWVVVWAEWVGSVAPVLRAPAPTALELAAAALLWTAAVCAARRIGPLRRCAFAGTAAVLVLVGSWVTTAKLAPRLRSDLRVTFLDVGHGDATVVELPSGGVWLIDSGGSPFIPTGDNDQREQSAEARLRERTRREEAPGAQSVARFLAHRRISRVDLAIVTHPHPDHYVGLRAVAREVEIGELLVARAHAEQPPEPGFRALLIQLAMNGTRVWNPPLGTVVRRGGVALSVLGPRYLDSTAAVDPVAGGNDNSMVVRLDFAGRRVLLTGDVEAEGEESLVGRYGRDGLRADVVKVPHHGSRTSSGPALVAATSPRYAVISCGVANRFGAPAAEVVGRWRTAGAEVLRTDLVGAITATISPGGVLSVHTFD